MTKTATIRARIEPRLKDDVEKLFKKMGLTTTEVLTIRCRTESHPVQGCGRHVR
ncbi:MAG: hypothetical protein JRF40_15585 [Deltaproteobacteria bacterium]|nr:hypothetical protein [Deltaproteobacteria bacterium]